MQAQANLKKLEDFYSEEDVCPIKNIILLKGGGGMIEPSRC